MQKLSFFSLENLGSEIRYILLCKSANLAKGSNSLIFREKSNSPGKRKKIQKGKIFLQASCCRWKMNQNTGLISLIGQNKAQPRVPGSCFVLSAALCPLGTNCAAQRVLLPHGLSWSLLDYNSQLLFQKHLFLFVLICFICMQVPVHTHICCVCTNPWLCFFKRSGVPRHFTVFHALASEGFRSGAVFIYGLHWQNAPYKCSRFSSIELSALTPEFWSCRARGIHPNDVLSWDAEAKNMLKMFGEWSSNL